METTIDQLQISYARKNFAISILANAGLKNNPVLELAFSNVDREKFLGPKPWRMLAGNRVQELVSDNPVVVYQDFLFEIDEKSSINNGSPSLHAWMINRVGVKSGQCVAHLGIGLGYYTAILSKVVGPSGHVIAVEADAGLSKSSQRNLVDFSNVEIVCDNGGNWPKTTCDIIYVNYAVLRPFPNWFRNLSDGGKLIFPLGVPARDGRGGYENYTSRSALILVERSRENLNASFLGYVTFVCDCMLDHTYSQKDIEKLTHSFETGGIENISRLRIGNLPKNKEWFSGLDWGLEVLV